MEKLRAPAFLCSLGITVFYLLTIREGHPWGDDFVQYIQHAMNLEAGDPYGAQPYVVNPTRSIGPPAYPPVFPLLLLPILKVAGLDFAVLKVMMSLCFGAALLSIAFAFSRVLSEKQLVALLLLLGLAPTFWTFKEAVFSDVPFLVFCFAALALIQRLIATAPGRPIYPLAAATGLAIYLACGTRSQGLPLLPTLLVADAFRWRRIRLAPLMTCALAGLLLFVQNRLVFTEAERLQYLSIDPVLLWSNVTHYLGSLSTYWDNGYYHPLRYLVFGVSLVLALIGYWKRLRGGLGAFEVFLPLFLLPLLFWVFQQGIRYLLPIVPIYLYYAIEGADEIAARLTTRNARRVQWSLFAGACLAFLSAYTTIDLRHIEGPLDPNAREMFREVQGRTDPEDLVVFEKPRVLALMAERKTLIPSLVEDSADDSSALALYRALGVDYLVTGRSFATDLEYLQPFLERNPSWAEKLWSNDEFELYRVRGGTGQ